MSNILKAVLARLFHFSSLSGATLVNCFRRFVLQLFRCCTKSAFVTCRKRSVKTKYSLFITRSSHLAACGNGGESCQVLLGNADTCTRSYSYKHDKDQDCEGHRSVRTRPRTRRGTRGRHPSCPRRRRGRRGPGTRACCGDCPPPPTPSPPQSQAGDNHLLSWVKHGLRSLLAKISRLLAKISRLLATISRLTVENLGRTVLVANFGMRQ